MHSWSTPLLPAIVLLGGAFLIWLLRRFSLSRWPAPAPFVALLIAAIAIWMLHRPVSGISPLMTLPSALGTDLSLRVQFDEWGRLFGLLLLWPMLAAAIWQILILVPSSPPKEFLAGSPNWLRWLLILAATHTVLAAADWLTLMSALVIFDLVQLVTAEPQSQSESGWSFKVNSLGSLAIFAAAFTLALEGHSLELAGRTAPLPGLATTLIAGAAIIRLAPYPLHFWLSNSPQPAQPAWRWPVKFSSSILGLYLLARLVPLPAVPLLGGNLALATGIASCMAAALMAWLAMRRKPQQAIPFVGLYQLGLALLNWVMLGQRFTGFWTGLLLILGTTALTIHRGWVQEHESLTWKETIPGTVAIAALAGLPLTVGFLVRLPLYGALLNAKLAGWLILLLVSESLLIATLLEMWNGPHLQTRQHPPAEPRSWNEWGAILLLVAPLLLLGVFPSLAARLANFPTADRILLSWPVWEYLAQSGIGLWATLLLPLAMGYGIYRSKVTWPAEMDGAKEQLTTFLHLGWLYHALDRLLSLVRQVIWSAGLLLHGEGYLAWVSLSLLLIFILILSR